MGGDDAFELVDYLVPEQDEVSVISAVTKIEHGDERIVRASLLIGPTSLGNSNWQGWQAEHLVQPIGQPEPDGPTYATSASDYRSYRVVTAIDDATRWLAELLSVGRSNPLAALPSVSASLVPPQAPIRVSPHLDSDASTFIYSAVRPATGFHFRGAEVDEQLPDIWNYWGADHINSPLSMGLLCTPGMAGGVVLARLERRAWFSLIRGGEDLETFDCQIGLDPERIDVADLAVSLDEWIDGELVHSQQVRMGELDVDIARGHPAFTIRLPTLGTHVQRSLQLRDQHGTLLDTSRSQFSIVESIVLATQLVGNAGAGTVITVAGQQRPVPSLVERASDVERVKNQYEVLYSKGADCTLYPPGSDLRSAMQDRLTAARGTLRIVDRYFGVDPLDWDILDKVTVPCEVLTSKGQVPPTSISANITVKWIKGGRPPFHGRAYLWEGGGLVVDASPNGFGSNPVIATSLPPAAVANYEAIFANWWKVATTAP